MTNVSLMVQPSQDPDQARFYRWRSGVWSDVLSPQTGLTTIRGKFEQGLNELMDMIDHGGDHATNWLAAKAQGLYEAVVPTEIRSALDETLAGGHPGVPPVLRFYIHRSLDWIPWEIMHDGHDFLGLRYQVVRLPIVPNGPDVEKLHEQHPVSEIRNVLGEHILEDHLFDLWESTFELLVPAAAVTKVPSGDGWPTIDHIVDSADADIIHVTCHGGLSTEDGDTYWTLNEQGHQFKYHIDPDVVKIMAGLPQRQPLVFGNACASAAANGSGTGLTPGLGTAFFDQGAIAFVGTFAPIRQSTAVDFAREFYNRLLGDGMPIGQAMWETKRHFSDAGGNDPSWLFYCLYGPPETRFTV